MKSINWNQQFNIPRLVKTDSYKAGHFTMYPDSEEMTAYIEARKPFRDGEDPRIVHFGINYFIDKYLSTPITHDDIDEALEFYKTHGVGSTEYPFPEQLFRDIVNEENGHWPVVIRSLPDGSVVRARTPQVLITAKGKYAKLVTFLETSLLSCIWYMSTVATHSRLARQVIEDAFDKSTDEDAYWKISSRLHDFGYRGCTGEEQAMIGGAAHLLSFDGTDTMAAAWLTRQLLPKGEVNFDSSIPATEHSVMTSWDTELEATLNMADKYGHTVFATVADSYDYNNFLWNIVPEIAPIVKEKGGFHVVRPDSGNPVTCVIDGLIALDHAYGSFENSKGYRVINNAGIIQGDGIGLDDIKTILEAVLKAGYSAECVAFGMGAGLLQKLNRDTCSYAMKLCYRVTGDWLERPIMKAPSTDMTKASWPSVGQEFPGLESLPVIYSSGKVSSSEDFVTIRSRLDREWKDFQDKGHEVHFNELITYQQKVYHTMEK